MLQYTIKNKIEASGYTKSELAKKLGLTLNGFSQKLRQTAYTGRKGQQAYSSFSDSEVKKLEKILEAETEAEAFFKKLHRRVELHARAVDKVRSLKNMGLSKEEIRLYAKA